MLILQLFTQNAADKEKVEVIRLIKLYIPNLSVTRAQIPAPADADFE